LDHHIFAYQASFIYEKIDDASVLFSSIRKNSGRQAEIPIKIPTTAYQMPQYKVSRSYWTNRILLSG